MLEQLHGRSLPMREYLERVLWRMDMPAPLGGRDILEDDHEARLASLRECIVDYEIRQMFHRLAHEGWTDIRRSAAGGRWE